MKVRKVVCAVLAITALVAASSSFAWNGDEECGSYEVPCICTPDTPGCFGDPGN